jgi:UDP-N-acetylglucosamine 2-epimerase
LAGALAACKLHVPVAHVEAGLRSYNRGIPEEINRVIVDHVSSLLFCPTENAVNNLRREGITDGDVAVVYVGDVMYDSALHNVEIAEEKSGMLRELGLLPGDQSSSPSEYLLVTIHRAENTDNPQRLRNIITALDEASKRSVLIFPLHPRTKKTMEGMGIKGQRETLRLIDPVSYFDMLLLERHARVILTDSGGVQKEAFWFGVPCITLREETEWTETVGGGWNRLVGADTHKIVEAVHEALGLQQSRSTGKGEGIYGDGRAGERIVAILRDRLSGNL